MNLIPFFAPLIKPKITKSTASDSTIGNHLPISNTLFTFEKNMWKYICSWLVYFTEPERRNKHLPYEEWTASNMGNKQLEEPWQEIHCIKN